MESNSKKEKHSVFVLHVCMFLFLIQACTVDQNMVSFVENQHITASSPNGSNRLFITISSICNALCGELLCILMYVNECAHKEAANI